MGANKRLWKTCEECNRKTKRARVVEGKILCFFCSTKYLHKMPYSKMYRDYELIDPPHMLTLNEEDKRKELRGL